MVILYADEDADDRELFTDMIQEIDPKITVVEFQNYDLLIDALSDVNDSANAFPSIIFVANGILHLNGFHTLVKLRKDARFAAVPVVLYFRSLQGSQGLNIKGLNAIFVEKPNSVKGGIIQLKKTMALFTSDRSSAAGRLP